MQHASMQGIASKIHWSFGNKHLFFKKSEFPALHGA
jgi:hypothetical protein